MDIDRSVTKGLGRLGFSVPLARLAEWHAAALVDQAYAGPTERPALDTACLLLPGVRLCLHCF